LTCSAPLCPLDPELAKRSWTIGEEVCTRSEHKEEPWIRRQKKLNRVRPASLMGQTFTTEYLTSTAPQKRTLSPEHRARLREFGRRYQFGVQNSLS